MTEKLKTSIAISTLKIISIFFFFSFSFFFAIIRQIEMMEAAAFLVIILTALSIEVSEGRY